MCKSVYYAYISVEINTHVELVGFPFTIIINGTIIEKVATHTFNNNIYGAQLLPVNRFTLVNSSILHDSVSEYDGLIMVKWIELLHPIIITC